MVVRKKKSKIGMRGWMENLNVSNFRESQNMKHMVRESPVRPLIRVGGPLTVPTCMYVCFLFT